MKHAAKKPLTLLVAVILLTGVLCLGAAGEQAAGRTYDAGRVAVTVPGGWNIAAPVTGPDPCSVQLVRGGTDPVSLLMSPSIWVNYTPVGLLVADVSGLTDASEAIEPFSLGGYDWTGYRYESFGMKGISLTAVGPFGTLSASLIPQGMLGGGAVSLEDEDVRTILSSITVKPTMTPDWVTLNGDGTVTVRLPRQEGLTWSTSFSGSYDLDGDGEGPEGEVGEHLEDGCYVAVISLRGSGAFSQGFCLEGPDDMAGEAFVAVLCEDGRATGVTDSWIRGIGEE